MTREIQWEIRLRIARNCRFCKFLEAARQAPAPALNSLIQFEIMRARSTQQGSPLLWLRARARGRLLCPPNQPRGSGFDRPRPSPPLVDSNVPSPVPSRVPPMPCRLLAAEDVPGSPRSPASAAINGQKDPRPGSNSAPEPSPSTVVACTRFENAPRTQRTSGALRFRPEISPSAERIASAS